MIGVNKDGVRLNVSFKWDIDPSIVLRNLGRRMSQNILRKAIRKANNIIKDEFKTHVPGDLGGKIGVKVSTKANSNVVKGVVGVRRSSLDKRNMPVNIMALLNLGRKELVLTKKSALTNQKQVSEYGYKGPARFFGKTAAATRPKHYTEDVAATAGGRAQQVMMDTLGEEIQKALTK